MFSPSVLGQHIQLLISRRQAASHPVKRRQRGAERCCCFGFFAFAAVQCAPADTVMRELKAVNVCLSSCETAFEGFLNLLTKVKKKKK